MRPLILFALMAMFPIACGNAPDHEGFNPVDQDNALGVAILKANVQFERILFMDLYPQDMDWDGIYERSWALVEDLGGGFQVTWVSASSGAIIDQIEPTLEIDARAERARAARSMMIPADPKGYRDECTE